MDQDKVFNLQLIIQKLQEELSIYRNGASGEELFQLIAEKESEIKVLKASSMDKNENLKKLAKKSAEVLARCDRLQSEYDTLQFEHSDLIQEKKRLVAQVEVLKTANSSFAAVCEEKKVTIDQLEEELTAREESIEKLLARCAALVSQKNEKHKEFEAEAKDFAVERSDKNKQMKELMDELERALRLNTEAKERLNKEHANSLELTSELRQSQIDLNNMIETKRNIEISNAALTSEIQILMEGKLESEKEVLRVSDLLCVATSKSCSIQSEVCITLADRDAEITQLHQNIKSLAESSASETRRLDEERRADVSRSKTEVESLGRKLRKLEAEREVSDSHLKEIEVLKLKNSELEEKIKRQDQYMKNRLLKDKTNFNPGSLCTPEPSEPSYRPPSARALAFASNAAASLKAPTGDVRAVKAMR